MAGKATKTNGLDPVSEAALEVVKVEQQRADLAKQEQDDRERLIAQTHQMIGQIRAADVFGKFANVSSLIWLQQVKESKIYRDLPDVGTWEKFCEYIGLSRQKVDLDLQNLATFGEEFLLTVSSLSIGYRDLRKLRQLSHDGTVTIDAEFMVIGEERIPLDQDHREELQSAIETIIEQQAALQADADAQKKAHDRVQKDTHNSVVKLQKELDKLTAAAAAKGLTPAEDAFIQKCDNARLTIDGFLNEFDPDINPLPDDATPRMKSTIMHTLAWFKRCINISFDTANDLYGDPEMDDTWIPPHLRAPQKEEATDLPESIVVAKATRAAKKAASGAEE